MRRPSLPSLNTTPSSPALKTTRSNSSAHLLPPHTKPRSATLSGGSSPSGIVSPKAAGGTGAASRSSSSCSRATSPVSVRHDLLPSMIARPASSLASPRLASPSSGRCGNSSKPTQLDTTAARRPSLSPRIGASLNSRIAENSPKVLPSPRLGQSLAADGRFSSECSAGGANLRPGSSNHAATTGPQSSSGIPSWSSVKSRTHSNGQGVTTGLRAPASPVVGGLSSGTNVSTTPTTITTITAATTLVAVDAQVQPSTTSTRTRARTTTTIGTHSILSSQSTAAAASAEPTPSPFSHSSAKLGPTKERPAMSARTKSGTIKPPSIVTKPTPFVVGSSRSVFHNEHPTPASSSLPTAVSSNGKSWLPLMALTRQGVATATGVTHYHPAGQGPATPMSNPSPSSARRKLHCVGDDNNNNNDDDDENDPYSSSDADAMSIITPPSTTPSPPPCSLTRSKNRLHAGVDSACFMTRKAGDPITTLSTGASGTGRAGGTGDSSGVAGTTMPTTMTASATLQVMARGSSPSEEKVRCDCPPPLTLPEFVQQEIRREEEEHRRRECDLYAKIIELQIEIENLKGEKESLTRVVGRRERSLEALQRQLEALEHICRENRIEVDIGLCSAEVVENWNIKESDEVYQRILFTMQDMLRTGSKCVENHRPLGLLAGSATIAAGGGGQERHSLHHKKSSINAKAAAAVAYLNDQSQYQQQQETCSGNEPAPRRALDDNDSRRRVLLAMGEPVDSLPEKDKGDPDQQGSDDEDDDEDSMDEDDDGEESEFEELGEDMLKFAELQSEIMPRRESHNQSISSSKLFSSPNMSGAPPMGSSSSSSSSSRGPLTPDVTRSSVASIAAYRPRSREGSTHSRQSTSSNLLDDYFTISTPISAHTAEVFPPSLPPLPTVAAAAAAAAIAATAAPSTLMHRAPAPSRPLPPPPHPQQQQQPLTGLGIVMTTRSLSHSQLRVAPPQHPLPPPPTSSSPGPTQQRMVIPPGLVRSLSTNSVATGATAGNNNKRNSHRLSTSSTHSTTSNAGSLAFFHSLPPPQMPLPPIPTGSGVTLPSPPLPPLPAPPSSRPSPNKKGLQLVVVEPNLMVSAERIKQHLSSSSSRLSTLGGGLIWGGHGRAQSHGLVMDRYLHRPNPLNHSWTNELLHGGHRRHGSV
ncbi:hypothetical protein DFQ26_002696 [Actinomortierella ambigua]|nr:hypothetical protein DFQ26_002696 [Actinomortierella ambigua]